MMHDIRKTLRGVGSQHVLIEAKDMYHLVSAVVLGFTTTIFTEGRIWAASPPSYIAIYFMTIGLEVSGNHIIRNILMVCFHSS